MKRYRASTTVREFRGCKNVVFNWFRHAMLFAFFLMSSASRCSRSRSISRPCSAGEMAMTTEA